MVSQGATQSNTGKLFPAALVTIASIHTHQQKNKLKNGRHIHKMEFHSTIRKNEIPIFIRKLMALKIIMFFKINHTQNDKHIFSLVYGI